MTSSTEGAGSSADQHVTGSEDAGEFIVDEEPRADTPAHGSSNAGVNATGANRPADERDVAEGRS